MTQYYVLVAGSGKTSRANVEALMDDHYLANGEKGILVLPINKRPSDGQIWAAQFALEQKKDIVVMAKPNATYEGIVHSTLAPSNEPLEASVAFIKGERSSAFLLWDDEDEECSDLLSLCKEYKVPACDLTNGLVPLFAISDAKPSKRPLPPYQEMIPELTLEEDAVEEGEEEEYEETIEGTLIFAIEAVAQIFARAILDEIELRKEK